MEVILDQQAMDLLMKKVNGTGGHQSLLRRLQEQLTGTKLKYDEEDFEKIKSYADDYGKGGFQDRFKAVLKCIETS